VSTHSKDYESPIRSLNPNISPASKRLNSTSLLLRSGVDSSEVVGMSLIVRKGDTELPLSKIMRVGAI
jgi:hypothetical protein